MTRDLLRNDYTAPGHCRNPSCGRPLPPAKGAGRPRLYCSEPCRRVAHRRERDVPRGNDERDQTHLAAARLRQNTEELVHRARADRTLNSLRLLNSVERDVGLMRDALVQQARAARTPTAQIAAALGVSTGTLARRFAPARLSRRLAAALHAATGPATDFGPTSASHSPSASATEEPGRLLAMALGELVYGTSFSGRAIARRAGVDPSYLSRMLSGERRPSWEKTERVTRACQGDGGDDPGAVGGGRTGRQHPCG
ncbi:Helix-turn-helix domain-containing protein, partial [Streptomyces sp. SolWspMP-sol7th]|uniref:helix-turn-helix domain-containing protein n=1 Tax=Streptomyces sp. SolWspMP-sol7th TaxID=1839776 RepID=UPI00081EDAA6